MNDRGVFRAVVVGSKTTCKDPKERLHQPLSCTVPISARSFFFFFYLEMLGYLV